MMISGPVEILLGAVAFAAVLVGAVYGCWRIYERSPGWLKQVWGAGVLVLLFVVPLVSLGLQS